jgi:uncharacterized membrane protein (UPF0127 family)
MTPLKPEAAAISHWRRELPLATCGGHGEQMQAWNRDREVSLGDRIDWAGSSGSRKKGLLGRDSIEEGEGLYIVPCQWVHMFGMRFSVDIAFLNREGRVLSMQHALKPNRVSKLVWRAEGVLELPAGTLESSGTQLGDLIELIDEEQRSS